MRNQQHLKRDNSSSASKHRVHVTAGRFGKQPPSSSGFGHLNRREGFKVLLESTAGAFLLSRLARLTEAMVCVCRWRQTSTSPLAAASFHLLEVGGEEGGGAVLCCSCQQHQMESGGFISFPFVCAAQPGSGEAAGSF